MTEQAEFVRRAFFGDGLFDWQNPVGPRARETWDHYTFDADKWWGTFPRDDAPAVRGRRDDAEFFARFPWAVGPFHKHPNNPVLGPSPLSWDMGRYGGGVGGNATLNVSETTFPRD